ncbi:hypothetical protein V6N11_031667 [Hibiscus sabdariffa]|uniref:Uncharacterized protein n=1 Tax=Hibiscus sabdariffa TaxID=183260 RepID=A0ABR2SYC5_9ROSI
MQHDLSNAKKELATYIGPQALLLILQPPVPATTARWEPFFYDATKCDANDGDSHGGFCFTRGSSKEQQDLLRGYEQQQQQQQQGQQQEIVRFNSGFEGGASSVTATGFNQMTTAANMSPSFALGSFDNPYQIQTQQQDHHPLQAQLLIQPQQGQPQQQNQQPQRSESEEGRSSGPC